MEAKANDGILCCLSKYLALDHFGALAIHEEVLGPCHPNTAYSLNNLAALYWAQGKLEEAKPLYKQALEIFIQVLGLDHTNTRTVQNNYDHLRQLMKRDPQ